MKKNKQKSQNERDEVCIQNTRQYYIGLIYSTLNLIIFFKTHEFEKVLFFAQLKQNWYPIIFKNRKIFCYLKSSLNTDDSLRGWAHRRSENWKRWGGSWRWTSTSCVKRESPSMMSSSSLTHYNSIYLHKCSCASLIPTPIV